MYIYGLQAQHKNGFVDLESISAEVVIHGFVAHLSVDLAYRNKSEKVLEVAYVCPVHGKAAVYSFEAKLEGRTITAHCLEKKKAQQVYSNAVKQGHTAILGSENDFSGDLLHLSLGNFPKGEVAELKLKMVMELPVGVDGAVTFTLPTIFNPRYCPADQKTSYQFDGFMESNSEGSDISLDSDDGEDDYIPQAESSSSESNEESDDQAQTDSANKTFNAGHVAGSSHGVFPNQTSYSLDVKGEVRGSLKIAKVTSESDPVNVEISDEETTAVITQDGGSNLDHDWSFQVYYQTVHKAHALQMTGDRSSKGLMKNDVLMLNFFPEIPYECFNPHNELIFVVDRSGSMQGSSIKKAKSTLLLFLKSLPTGCRFNIISFGCSFSTLFQSSSERYTKNTLAEALRLQKSMDADMGGTEILGALKHVYSHDLIPGYARQMIVLTDGAVWNQSQIFDLVSQHADETRVFSVGIGDGASTALVQGIAEAGGGRYEMVVHNNQLQTKVMGLVASMLQDNVKDLRVNCELNPPQTHSLVPKIPPVVFGGQHLILYARVLPKTEIKSIKITGKIGEKELACEIGEKDCKIVRDSNFSFHRLAAKAQLKQWERDDTEGIQDDVIDLSVSSSVVCKATALVGIDQDGKIIKEEEQGPFEVNDSRMSVTYSYASCDIEDEDENLQEKSLRGGRFNQLCAKLTVKSEDLSRHKVQSTPTFSMTGRRATSTMLCSKNENRFVKGGPSNFINKSPTVDVEEEKKKKSVEDFLLVVSCQNFDGSWDLNDCLKFVKAPNDQIKNIQSELSLNDKCFATVLILAFLEIQFSSRKQEWHLLHIKGRIYLESKTIEATKVIEECSRQLQKILQITS